jgi:hypothetical protein
MKAKLLKQIRKRFEIKIVANYYICKNKKTGNFYANESFDRFIEHISEILGRFFEFNGYLIKKRYKKNQLDLKRRFK